MLKRTGWLILGWIAVILAGIGVILPVLPTVPFLLVAAVAFGNGSEKWHHWLINTRLYKRNFESFAKNKGMTRKTKMRVMITVTLIMLIGFLAMKDLLIPRVILATVWLGHMVYFIWRVKTIDEIN